MSNIIRKEENIELELSDNTLLSSLFGVNDANLTIIEKINDVKIQYRGNRVKISRKLSQDFLDGSVDITDLTITKLIKYRLTGNINRLLPLIRLKSSLFRKTKKMKWPGAKTCNLAVWKDDLLKINGFDE